MDAGAPINARDASLRSVLHLTLDGAFKDMQCVIYGIACVVMSFNLSLRTFMSLCVVFVTLHMLPNMSHIMP